MSARRRSCGQTNIRPNLRRAPAALPTPSYGSTRRPASTTTRARAITGRPVEARICAKPTRAGRAIAQREAANAKPRPIKSKRAEPRFPRVIARDPPRVVTTSFLSAGPIVQTSSYRSDGRASCGVTQLTLRHPHSCVIDCGRYKKDLRGGALVKKIAARCFHRCSLSARSPGQVTNGT